MNMYIAHLGDSSTPVSELGIRQPSHLFTWLSLDGLTAWDVLFHVANLQCLYHIAMSSIEPVQ